MSEALNYPSPRSGILDIDLYVPGKSKGVSGVKTHKLSSNETPFGPSPAAIEAFKASADHLERYPDGQATILKEKIAERYNLDPANILCGAGSDELLSLLAYAYLDNGDEAIYSQHGFLVYRNVIIAAGAKPIVVPEKNYVADVDAILKAVNSRTKMIFIANPNNPTGTYLVAQEIKRLHAALPKNVLLVLDAAYAEYVGKKDYSCGIDLVAQNNNVVMTRTFSKIYGLAALRIGWLYAPLKIVEILNRIRGPFNMNSPAIAAGSAAIMDIAHEKLSFEHNLYWIEKMRLSIEALGLEVTPSVANFLLIHFQQISGKTATDADEFLTQKGFILRRVAAYGLPDALRLSIGSIEANEGVLSAIKEFLEVRA